MIVLCPSCNTRYRHDPVEPAAAAMAECSRCDETFPMQESRRTYVLVPRQRPPAAIGMDDPSLAPRIVTADVPALTERILSGAGVVDLPSAGDVLAGYGLPEPETPAPRRSALFEFLIAVIPPSAGASLAYHLASRDQLDPVAWSALGGAAGFLLGWGCLLWIRRKD
jgi:hypothetical protein